MNTQTLAISTMLYSSVAPSLSTTTRPVQPLRACSRDYGFDIDEEALAKEHLAPLSTNHSKQAACGIDEDQAAATYLHFLS